MKRLDILKSAHLIGHRNPVYAIEMGAGGSFFTAGNDRGIVEWSFSLEDGPGTAAFKRVLCPVPVTVYSLHHLPEAQVVAAGLQDGSVLLVDTVSGHIKATLRAHDKPVFGLASRWRGVEGEGAAPELVLASEDGRASVWSLESLAEEGGREDRAPQLLRERVISNAPIRCMAVSPHGDWVCFGDKDGRLHLYKTEDLSLYKSWDAHDQTVTSVQFSADGRYVLSGGRDAQLYVWSVNDDLQLHTNFVPHLYAIYAIAYHPHLPVFATASRDKSIKIWSSDDFRLLRTISMDKGFDAHRHSVNALAWHPDGAHLFSVGDDRVVMGWQFLAE